MNRHLICFSDVKKNLLCTLTLVHQVGGFSEGGEELGQVGARASE